MKPNTAAASSRYPNNGRAAALGRVVMRSCAAAGGSLRAYAAAFMLLWVWAIDQSAAQQPPVPPGTVETETSIDSQPRVTIAPPAAPVEPTESLQVDVSTRSIPVTSSFTGVETVLFGAIDHSRQPSAESGYYDVVVILEGAPTELVARRKSNVAGIWVNTQSATFVSVPSYYAIVSTRPLDEVASPNVRSENDIGFQHVRMTPVQGWETGLTTADLADFKAAVIRLKQRDKLYFQQDYGVAFIGRSLFRANIGLPGNVPIGQLTARVYLFREGRLLSSTKSQVRLERAGLEQFVHTLAVQRPITYGMLTVAAAVIAGLAASALLSRARM